MQTSKGINLLSTGVCSGANASFTLGTGSLWSSPKRLDVIDTGRSIEVIYKQTSTFSLATYPPRPREERVYKIVYSCVDGKWNKSEPIYGKIVPAQGEHYEFE